MNTHFIPLAVSIAIAPTTSLAQTSSTAARAGSPNVLLIVSDDQGSIDLNCYGATDLFTPNLDRLASRGVKFTAMYSAFPICTPARGALLTGRYPQRNGAVTNGRAFKEGEVTIAEMLKPAGYDTSIVGKWHIGLTPGPNAEGFDDFFGHKEGCIENYNHDNYAWDTGEKKTHDLWHNDQPVYEKDTHFGELIVRETIRAIERSKEAGKPFFIYTAFNNPHYPVQPLPKHLERYKNLKEPRRSYAAFVSTMDDQVGRIVGKIDELGMRENTLIVFIADQGHSVETRNNLWLKDADPQKFGGGSAGKLRGNKFTLWEGGIRVPCIASMPGRIPEGETRSQVLSSMDWLPTIAGFCGVQPPQRKLDGVDIRSIIASASTPRTSRTMHWMMGNKRWAVREGKWKLVFDEGAPFLSNMDVDDTERNNLAEAEPATVNRLTQLHREWKKDVGTTETSAAAISASTSTVTRIEATSETTWVSQPWGEMGVVRLAAAPYPDDSRTTGFMSRSGKFFPKEGHYDDNSVVFAIPNGYKRGSTVDVIVHFHGHSNDAQKTLFQYKLGEQLRESGRNAILIIPEVGKNVPDEDVGKFEKSEGFAKFIAEALDTLRSERKIRRNAKLSGVILSGHSGGYWPIAKVLERGGITSSTREVWLFDAAYGGLKEIASPFGDPEAKIQLRSIFTDHLTTRNMQLRSYIEAFGRKSQVYEENDVTSVVAGINRLPELLRGEPIFFMHSSLRHDDVVAQNRYFEIFARESPFLQKID